MEESILFKYLVDSEFLCIDKEEIKSKHLSRLKPQYEQLKQSLSEKQFKVVHNYAFDLENHMFHIRDIECFKMFYLGIKLGMEVSDFCHMELEE